MRLLNFDNSYDLRTFFEENTPCYAILSHTWGRDEDEVTYRDLTLPGMTGKNGWSKLRFCKRKVEEQGLKYFWIDTCCIDKDNSSELLESLNSMYRWYKNATKCYVLLDDVHNDDDKWNAFRKSRWFTRGWTLQELIAPSKVEFYTSEGGYLGNKRTLETLLHEITDIPTPALRGEPLTQFNIRQRMSWMRKRRTKRPEDKAYCMMGIFGVFLPFLYGVGEDIAMAKLKQELDQTDIDARANNEGLISISGASYRDLAALNADQLKQLDSELKEFAHWFHTGERLDKRRFVQISDEANSRMWKLLNNFGIDYVKFTARLPHSKTIDPGWWSPYQWELSSDDKKYLRGITVEKTLRHLALWRGLWRKI